jgi:hypothetical protein
MSALQNLATVNIKQKRCTPVQPPADRLTPIISIYPFYCINEFNNNCTTFAPLTYVMRTNYSLWHESLPPDDVTYFVTFPYVLVMDEKVYTGFRIKNLTREKNKLLFKGEAKVMTACQAFKLNLNISQENHWKTIPGAWPYRKYVLPEEPLIFHYKERKAARQN